MAVAIEELSDDDLTKVMDSAILREAASKLDVDLRCDLHVKATDVSGFLNGKITGALQEFVNMPSRDAIGRAPLGKPGNILKKVRGLQDFPSCASRVCSNHEASFSYHFWCGSSREEEIINSKKQ